MGALSIWRQDCLCDPGYEIVMTFCNSRASQGLSVLKDGPDGDFIQLPGTVINS